MKCHLVSDKKCGMRMRERDPLSSLCFSDDDHRRVTCAGACAQVLFKVFSGLKPDVPADMPAEYRTLMEECWAADPQSRPSFRAILPRLRAMLAAARAAAAAGEAGPQSP